jgi:hypothetical protein
MGFFRAGKLRWLYLLALAQLVGGPLVLLQVTVFCKLALHEAPRVGVAKAIERAWSSDDFQAIVAAEGSGNKKNSKSPPSPTDGPKPKVEKSKLPMIAWEPAPLRLACVPGGCGTTECARVWTPAWPQAPPGPPPRLG